jgi:hypothetical protein
MTSVVLHSEPALRWQKLYQSYLADGLEAAGHTVRITHERHAAVAHGDEVPLLLGCNCFGDVQTQYAGEGRSYLMVNRAFWGDPFSVSIGWNGFNGNAEYCIPENAPRKAVPAYKPLRTIDDGHFAVVMGQLHRHTLNYAALSAWYAGAVKEIHAALPGMPVHFRPHPANPSSSWASLYSDSRPLEEVLADAAFVVTLNSTVAVDALLAGVPTAAYDPGSPAHPYARLQGPAAAAVGLRMHVHRMDEWLQRLAYAQWTTAEIQAGQPWPQLLHGSNLESRPRPAWPDS